MAVHPRSFSARADAAGLEQQLRESSAIRFGEDCVVDGTPAYRAVRVGFEPTDDGNAIKSTTVEMTVYPPFPDGTLYRKAIIPGEPGNDPTRELAAVVVDGWTAEHKAAMGALATGQVQQA